MISQKRNQIIIFSSIVVFLLSVFLGFYLSSKYSLYGDETHTLGEITHGEGTSPVTYAFLLLGEIEYESNNTPLFYVAQKGIVDLFDYQYISYQKTFNDPNARILLRINSVFFGSLMIALLFAHFSRLYSLWLGLYAIVLLLSSQLFLMYWVQGRPYMQWMSLTTIELLLFYNLIRYGYRPLIWNSLIFINICLVLTASFSMPCLVLLSFPLWLFVRKKWVDYVGLVGVPVMVTIYYLFKNKCPSGFYPFDAKDMVSVMFAVFQKERLLVLGLALFFAYVFFRNRNRIVPLIQESKGYLLLTLSFFLAAVSLLIFMKLYQNPHDGEFMRGATISNRYFVNIVPVSAIMGTFAFYWLVKMFDEKKWLQWVIILSVVSLSVARFFMINHKLGNFSWPL